MCVGACVWGTVATRVGGAPEAPNPSIWPLGWLQLGPPDRWASLPLSEIHSEFPPSPLKGPIHGLGLRDALPGGAANSPELRASLHPPLLPGSGRGVLTRAQSPDARCPESLGA